MIGTVVGSYKIVDKIGEGGMGVVFRGIDLMLEREVAVKVLRSDLARNAEIVERFRTEAVTLAKLNHPNIATLFNFIRQGDDLIMVMEFVRGETLDQIIRRRGLLPVDFGLPIFCQALEGIDHAHGMGIVHRDIKPANIMVAQSGLTKVMDFGIARVLGSTRMTRQGSVVGTVEYMSPEQILGKETDSRSDIYSLGIVLYEMVTGRAPFVSDSDYNLMTLQMEAAPPSPRMFVPNIPQAIESAIFKALSKNPDDRFQGAADFRNALIEGSAQQAQPSSPVPETRVSAPGQPWQAGYGNQYRSAEAPAQTGRASAGAWPGSCVPGRAPQANYDPAGVQPSVNYWQGQGAVGMRPARQPLLSRLTWKHYVGALGGLGVLIGLPLAIWALVAMLKPTEYTYLRRGDDFAAARKWDNAEIEFRRAEELNPADPPTHMRLYVTLNRQNKDQAGFLEWRRIYDSGQCPEVESYFRKLLSTQPGNADYQQYLALALQCQGKYAEAEKPAREAVRIDPNDSYYHNLLGLELDFQNKSADSGREYREAIQLDRKNSLAHLNLGTLLWSQKEYAKAEAEFGESIRLDPTYAKPHELLASLLQALERDTEAEAEFRDAVRLDPENPAMHDGLGKFLADEKKYAEAETVYREALRANPTYAPLHINLGNLLDDRSRSVEAEAEYREAIRIEPGNAAAHFNLGILMYNHRRLAEAEPEFREAIRLAPQESSYHEQLGDLLDAEGRRDEARAEYKEASRLGNEQ